MTWSLATLTYTCINKQHPGGERCNVKSSAVRHYFLYRFIIKPLFVGFVFNEQLLHGVQVDPGSHASGMTEWFVGLVFIEQLLHGVQVDPGSHASGMTELFVRLVFIDELLRGFK
ncbi:hypothetical protein [Pseudoalteromonas sp. OOF1S-7]|uniref:hypothetical protein n=1 Tax=Pseudoalteromonas sp. OOF1S-7 TaxID=2917757 RepID=UPI001EF5122E|nr:hypothetical protein [Pseudoalteromonas sp. OOF1S-7]MCG7537349.1 hypothetical protein [Pseudoalteromonas sp. OOF1S-7]